MSEETKEVDVLDQVKKIDKAVKAKLLIEKIAILKQYAREVNELREKSVANLEELGLSKKDIKRIIDYINELPEVKLSEKDKEAIRDEVNEELTEEKQTAEKSLREVDIEKLIGSGTGMSISGTNGWYTTSDNVTFTSTSDLIGNDSSMANVMYLASANDSSFMATIDNGKGDSLQVKL
jgi:uncharacterized protein YjiS (DUF1127 family)